MKNLFKTIAVALSAAALLFTARSAVAAEAAPLDTAGAAVFGATYVAKVTYADLTSTNKPAAQVITNGWFPANSAVQCVGLGIVVPFRGTATNQSTITCQLGDSVAAGTYLAASEVYDQTTDVKWLYGVSSNIVYTAANYAKWTFATTDTNLPAGSLSNFTQGEIRAYFRVRDLTKLP